VDAETVVLRQSINSRYWKKKNSSRGWSFFIWWDRWTWTLFRSNWFN